MSHWDSTRCTHWLLHSSSLAHQPTQPSYHLPPSQHSLSQPPRIRFIPVQRSQFQPLSPTHLQCLPCSSQSLAQSSLKDPTTTAAGPLPSQPVSTVRAISSSPRTRPWPLMILLLLAQLLLRSAAQMVVTKHHDRKDDEESYYLLIYMHGRDIILMLLFKIINFFCPHNLTLIRALMCHFCLRTDFSSCFHMK
jgi:hypothetical protein